MLDFGWAELFLVVAVAIFVIGPKDIPGVMAGLGRLFRRFQYMKYAVSQQFDQFMDVADVRDLQQSVNFEAKPDAHEDFDEAGEDEDVMVPLPAVDDKKPEDAA